MLFEKSLSDGSMKMSASVHGELHPCCK